MAKTKMFKGKLREEAHDDGHRGQHLGGGGTGRGLTERASPGSFPEPHMSRKVPACPDLRHSQRAGRSPDPSRGHQDVWAAGGCSPGGGLLRGTPGGEGRLCLPHCTQDIGLRALGL